MTAPWNDELFENFKRLRDAFRSAKKDKDYQHVLSIGLSILELDKSASFLQIATPIFQKDMADACTKLGDIKSAIEYLVTAKAGFVERKRSPGDWQKDIDLIDRKLAKLRTCA